MEINLQSYKIGSGSRSHKQPPYHDTGVYRLSEPLFKYLRSKPPDLDYLTTECLTDLIALLNTTLHPYQHMLSLTSSASGSQQQTQPSIECNFHKEIKACWLREDVSETSKTGTKPVTAGGNEGRNNAIGDESRGNAPVGAIAGPSHDNQLVTPPGSRAPKNKVLLAVHPYTEFTGAASNTTAMIKFLGVRFAGWWNGWKTGKTVCAGVAIPITVISGVLYFVQHRFWYENYYWMAPLWWLSVTYFLVGYLSLVNMELLSRCLRTYEALWLLLEASLFILANYSMSCFSLRFSMFPIGLLLLSVPYIFYDTYSVARRRKARPFLVLWALGFASWLMLLYCRVLDESEACYYKADLFHGFVTEQQLADGEIKLSRWNISIFDFSLNRGFTLLVLKLKIIYSSYKHPTDCAILKSRLRMIESSVSLSTTKKSISVSHVSPEYDLRTKTLSRDTRFIAEE